MFVALVIQHANCMGYIVTVVCPALQYYLSETFLTLRRIQWSIIIKILQLCLRVKVKVTLVQALWLCTGSTDQRGSRGIALLFYDHCTRRGWGVSVTPRRLLLPRKTRYPLHRRLGAPQARSGQVRKISPPPGSDPRTVQPVASRYTDYATRPVRLHVRYPLFLSYFNQTWIFWTEFRKNLQISDFIKIRPVGTDLLHSYGQTDMTKLIDAFRNFAKATKNCRTC